MNITGTPTTEAILNAWAAGVHTRAIAEAAHVNIKTVKAVVGRARLWADERVKVRHTNIQPRHSQKIISVVQRLTDDGLSASQIAAEAGKELGREFTRNSIIGLWFRRRVLRAGALPRKKPIQSRTYRQPKSKQYQEPIKLPTESWAPLDGIEPIALAGLNSKTCRWPVWRVSSDHNYLKFCGAPPLDGGSYCLIHHHISIAPPRIRK